MAEYSLNIAKKTGVQHPPARHWCLVKLGSYEDEAKEKAEKLIEMFGRDEYVFTFRKEYVHAEHCEM